MTQDAIVWALERAAQTCEKDSQTGFFAHSLVGRYATANEIRLLKQTLPAKWEQLKAAAQTVKGQPTTEVQPAPAAAPVSWAGDWTEDYVLENGHYFNTCVECGKQFAGHKRRVICKVCAVPAPELAGGMPEIKCADRMLLYNDTLGGKQINRDDMWAITTAEAEQLQKRVTELEDRLREIRLDLTSVTDSPRAEVMIVKIDAALAARREKDKA